MISISVRSRTLPATLALGVAALILLGSCKPSAIRGVAFQKLDTPQFCAFGKFAYDRKPERCDLYTSRGTDLAHGNPSDGIYQWRSEKGRIVTFVGKRHPGGVLWWFGKLNGKPAAAYSMNSHHHIFVTRDGNQQFETWIRGWEGNSPFALPQAQ